MLSIHRKAQGVQGHKLLNVVHVLLPDLQCISPMIKSFAGITPKRELARGIPWARKCVAVCLLPSPADCTASACLLNARKGALDERLEADRNGAQGWHCRARALRQPVRSLPSGDLRGWSLDGAEWRL